MTLIAKLLILISVDAQSVGIGTATPDTSAILHLSSTTKGFLVPRMDSIQRNGIATPAQGLLIYQSKGNGGFYYYAGNTWSKVGGGGNEWLINAGNDLYTNRNVGFGNSSPVEKLDINGNIKTSGNILTAGEIKPNGTAGLVNQVLTATGTGSMVWANAATGEESVGAGTWGDCSVNGITAFQPVANESGTTQDRFGRCVAISGDFAIVGATLDNEGVGLFDNGSATIFKRNSITGIWESQGKLVNPAAASNDFFGSSVAISGDYAIVGAEWDNSDDLNLSHSGSATIFKRNTTSGVWESQGKLVNPAAAANDNFGNSVSISGDFAIVGAASDDEGAGLVNSGSATIFKRNTVTGVWESQGKLVNAAAVASDNFGHSVGIFGDYAIVGAPYDEEGAGLDMNGTATIFKRNAITGAWESQGKLVSPYAATGDYFGYSVAISGDYAIIGVISDDEESAGLSNNGSAIIFKRNIASGIWQFQGKLLNPGAASDDSFGNSVAISGDYAIVGAISDDEGVGLVNNGSATIFRRAANVWLPVQKFIKPYGGSSDDFGRSVNIDGLTHRFLVGSDGNLSKAGTAFFGKVK